MWLVVALVLVVRPWLGSPVPLGCLDVQKAPAWGALWRLCREHRRRLLARGSGRTWVRCLARSVFVVPSGQITWV